METYIDGCHNGVNITAKVIKYTLKSVKVESILVKITHGSCLGTPEGSQAPPGPSMVGPRSPKGSHLELILVTFSGSKIRLFLLPICERSEHRLGSSWGPMLGAFSVKKLNMVRNYEKYPIRIGIRLQKHHYSSPRAPKRHVKSNMSYTDVATRFSGKGSQ